MAWDWVVFGAVTTSLATIGLVVVGWSQIRVSRQHKALLQAQHAIQRDLVAMEERYRAVDVVFSWAQVDHGGRSFLVITNRGFVAAGIESLDIQMPDSTLDRHIAGTRLCSKGVMSDRSMHEPLVVQPFRSYEVPIGFAKG